MCVNELWENTNKLFRTMIVPLGRFSDKTVGYLEGSFPIFWNFAISFFPLLIFSKRDLFSGVQFSGQRPFSVQGYAWGDMVVNFCNIALSLQIETRSVFPTSTNMTSHSVLPTILMIFPRYHLPSTLHLTMQAAYFCTNGYKWSFSAQLSV